MNAFEKMKEKLSNQFIINRFGAYEDGYNDAINHFIKIIDEVEKEHKEDVV